MRPVAFLVGLVLAAYGGLVAIRVIAHEAPWLGVVLLVAGAALAWHGVPAAAEPARPPRRGRDRGRALVTLGLGVVSAGGVLAYNAWARSSLGPPEVAILIYGCALVLASQALDRQVGPARVGTVVAWSLPLVAAPLGLYALNGALAAGEASSPLGAVVSAAFVAPTAWTLAAMGLDVEPAGQTLTLGTPQGPLALTVGVVCAGFQPAVLFLGVLALHAWRERLPRARLALLLLVGLVGVYLTNLARLVLLALVGREWGGAALQFAHANAGWVLFVAWMLAFWVLIVPRIQGRRDEPGPLSAAFASVSGCTPERAPRR